MVDLRWNLLHITCVILNMHDEIFLYHCGIVHGVVSWHPKSLTQSAAKSGNNCNKESTLNQRNKKNNAEENTWTNKVDQKHNNGMEKTDLTRTWYESFNMVKQELELEALNFIFGTVILKFHSCYSCSKWSPNSLHIHVKFIVSR